MLLRSTERGRYPYSKLFQQSVQLEKDDKQKKVIYVYVYVWKIERKSGDSNIFESPTDSLKNIWITNDSLKNIQTEKE